MPTSTKYEILCPNCMLPNAPAAHFCKHCVAPLDTFASTDPIASIYARFDTFGKASRKPRNAIVLIGMWLTIGMLLLLPSLAYFGKFILDLTNDLGDATAMAKDALGILIAAAFAIVPAFLLFRTTQNYFQKSPNAETEEEDAEDQHEKETDPTNDDDEAATEETESPT